MDFFSAFFDTQGFMPHGMCILWRPDILYPRIIAELLTGLAYFSTAAGVVVFLRRRKDVPFRPFFILYGSLIFIACGSSHFMGVWTLWYPDYGVQTVILTITAISSVAAALILWPLIPRLVALPTPALLEDKNRALQREVEVRERAEADVRQLNVNLEKVVAERTEQLAQTNAALQQNVVELEQSHAMLEQRVEERTIELNQSLEALQAAQSRLVETEKIASLGALVAGVAHEINTPLGVGVTAASLLQQQTVELATRFEADTLERSYLREYVQDVQQVSESILLNLKRAAHQIQGFKELAVDQVIERPRRFQVKGYLEEVIGSLHSRLRYTKVILTCPDDLELESDPGIIAQILNNLLINSVIHGFDEAQGGEIEITVTSRDDQMVLEYSDNGHGMDAAQLKRLYEPFYTTRRNQGRTGLGMSITYNLVTQRLGGQIDCQSAPGEGVHFTMTMAGVVS